MMRDALKREALKREAGLYFSAQEFLTRLPVPGWTGHAPDRLARATRYFPLVGLAVGGAGALVWLAAGSVAPAALAAGLALTAMVLTTGGLHEDGLADCCDGLGGGRTKDRALEIMRDSRIGAYGALGLILSLGLRWAALAGFSMWEGAVALIVAAMAGRAAMTAMIWGGTYARAQGAGSGVAGGARFTELAIAVGLALIAALGAGLPGVLALAAALVLAGLWLAHLTQRLGGYTGDGLGAAEQIGQIAVLTVLAGTWA